jgi:hypothetical protein
LEFSDNILWNKKLPAGSFHSLRSSSRGLGFGPRALGADFGGRFLAASGCEGAFDWIGGYVLASTTGSTCAAADMMLAKEVGTWFPDFKSVAYVFGPFPTVKPEFKSN